MGRVHPDHEILGQHGREYQVGLVGQPAAKGDVQFAVAQAPYAFIGGALVDVEHDAVAEGLAKAVQQLGQEGALNGNDRADVNLADEPAAVQLHQVDGLVHLAERPADVLVEFGAVGCQAHVAPHALEELHAELPFQVADRIGKRGLGDEKLLRGFSVMLDFSQLAEVVQLR